MPIIVRCSIRKTFRPFKFWNGIKKIDGLFCHRLLNYSQETFIIIDEAYIVFCLRLFSARDSCLIRQILILCLQFWLTVSPIWRYASVSQIKHPIRNCLPLLLIGLFDANGIDLLWLFIVYKSMIEILTKYVLITIQMLFESI